MSSFRKISFTILALASLFILNTSISSLTFASFSWSYFLPIPITIPTRTPTPTRAPVPTPTSVPVPGIRILIMGNSITIHDPAPEIGWYGNWGMAASSQQNDYVHKLMQTLSNSQVPANIRYRNIADFERNYWNYDLTALSGEKGFAPQILILKIGENVDENMLNTYSFNQYYQNLISYLSTGETKVICANTFWQQDRISNIILQVCNKPEINYYFVDLSQMYGDSSYMAIGQFPDPGVAAHPGDKGMAKIAQLIGDKLLPVLQSVPTPTLGAPVNSARCANPYGPVIISWNPAANAAAYRISRSVDSVWNYDYLASQQSPVSDTDAAYNLHNNSYDYNVKACRTPSCADFQYGNQIHVSCPPAVVNVFCSGPTIVPSGKVVSGTRITYTAGTGTQGWTQRSRYFYGPTPGLPGNTSVLCSTPNICTITANATLGSKLWFWTNESKVIGPTTYYCRGADSRWDPGAPNAGSTCTNSCLIRVDIVTPTPSL